ncbi:hypothetical protein ACFX15_009106 [Malus domestica]
MICMSAFRLSATMIDDGDEDAFQLRNVTREGKGGTEEEKVGCPGGECSDESGPTLTQSMSPIPVGSCPWDMVRILKRRRR